MDEKKQATAPIMLAVATEATYTVEIRNAREFRPEGRPDVFFSADAEMATPGKRWATLRLKVTSKTGPVPTGLQKIALDSCDYKTGLGVAHVVAG